MKLAIIDLDGVVANVDARFALAEEVKQQWIAAHMHRGVIHRELSEPNATDVYWRAVFDPDRVFLDTLIDGAKAALETIRENRPLMLLTSRPESMRAATEQWLYDHGVLFFHERSAALVMKPTAFQYTKTVVWKAGMVQMLASLYGAHEVLVIDDEAQNRDHLVQFAETFIKLVQVESLAQAVAYVRDGTLPESKPF